MNKIRPRVTYANVISTLCLFLLLGGGAYAAMRLPKNSVGGRQLQKNAVTSVKVKNHSLKAVDFKAGQLPTGPRGEKGDTGEPGPFPSELPAGKTIVGAFYFGGYAGGASELATSAISYLYKVPPAQSTVYVKEGESSLTCPGTPENPTAPSHTTCLCESFAYNVEFGRGYVLLGKTGVGLYARSNGPEDFYVEGTWAATG